MIAQLFLGAAELVALLNAAAPQPDPNLPQKRAVLMRTELPKLPVGEQYLFRDQAVYRLPTADVVRLKTDTNLPLTEKQERTGRVQTPVPTEAGRLLLLRQRFHADGRSERELLEDHWLRSGPLHPPERLKSGPSPDPHALPLHLRVSSLTLRRFDQLTPEDHALIGSPALDAPTSPTRLAQVRGPLLSGLSGRRTRSEAWVWMIEWDDVGLLALDDAVDRQLAELIVQVRALDDQITTGQTALRELISQRRHLAAESTGLMRRHRLTPRTVGGYRVSRGEVVRQSETDLQDQQTAQVLSVPEPAADPHTTQTPGSVRLRPVPPRRPDTSPVTLQLPLPPESAERRTVNPAVQATGTKLQTAGKAPAEGRSEVLAGTVRSRKARVPG